MNKTFSGSLLYEKFLITQASPQQVEYLADSTYDIVTPSGRNYSRNMELLAFNTLTGNALVKEHILFDGTGYEKVYILSKDGKVEKNKRRLVIKLA